ncbi:MAG: DUF4097 domain-containing protein [Acidobacteriia bacterium]|nr:DUF4097 domain-containing protein [Terriglobia bacterium]
MNVVSLFPEVRKTHFLGSALLLLIAGIPVAQAQSSAEKAFLSGGRIELQLEAGDYEVKPSADNTIRVNCSGTDSGQVRVTVNINGSHADVHVANTPNNNFHTTIEIPSTSDLTIRLTAGDLRIGAITGNKDISLRAGDLDVRIDNPDDYARVEASVKAGDVNASAFGGSVSGLFRTFRWTGKGKYTLKAHLIAGDVNLRK